MVSESSYPVMGNLVNFEQMCLLRASKKYLENTALLIRCIVKNGNVLFSKDNIILTVESSLVAA